MYLTNITRRTPPLPTAPVRAPAPLHPGRRVRAKAGSLRPPVRQEGAASRPASRLSPQLLFDSPAGLFGRGHHLGSRRSLVLQDSLDGPVRGRRGRHCRSLRLSAQGRCWRGVLEEKGWALLRSPRRPRSPGRAQAAAPAVAETTTGATVTTQ